MVPWLHVIWFVGMKYNRPYFTKGDLLAIYFFHQTNIPIFKIKESTVRRRYSDFEWLKKELERDSKVSFTIDDWIFFHVLNNKRSNGSPHFQLLYLDMGACIGTLLSSYSPQTSNVN